MILLYSIPIFLADIVFLVHKYRLKVCVQRAGKYVCDYYSALTSKLYLSLVDLLGNGDYYNNAGIYPQYESRQFDVHQRLDGGLAMNSNITTDNSYSNILRQHANPPYMKFSQHATLHHSPIQNASQESGFYQNNTYSYEANAHNLHMNSVPAMW